MVIKANYEFDAGKRKEMSHKELGTIPSYATLALGGHVRVGLEDKVYFSKGEKATNPQLMARAAAANGVGAIIS